MIHQFTATFAEPKYWLNERETRAALLGRAKDEGQRLDYQTYRLGFLDVSSNTNARTAIMTMLPRSVFCPHTMPTASVSRQGSNEPDHRYEVFFCALIISTVVDFI